MEAVEMVKSEDFDLIVMDIMMPKLDGFSTCKEIKKYKPEYRSSCFLQEAKNM